MRRLLSLVLLAAFVLPIAAPLLALGQDADAGLPACCRRHGKHHCTMTPAERGAMSQLAAVCPRYPSGVAVQPPALRLALFATAPQAARHVALSAPLGEDAPAHHSLRDRSQSTRGPPASLLL